MRKSLFPLFIIFPFFMDAQPAWEWAENIGGSDSEQELSVATDVDGNVFLAGNFSSAILTIGSATLTNASAGQQDLFVAKMDNSGNVLWATSAGGSILDRVFSIATDADGNCYVAGSFNSPKRDLFHPNAIR